MRRRWFRRCDEGHADPERIEEPAADEGTEDADDDVTQDPVADATYDNAGKQTGYQADEQHDDQGSQVHVTLQPTKVGVPTFDPCTSVGDRAPRTIHRRVGVAD